MHALYLPLLLLSFQVSTLPLPPQRDLDLPVVLGTYDPDLVAPAAPPAPDQGDPRDEPVPVFYGEEIAAEVESLIYVIDFSGSMDYGTRLETAKDQFRRSVSGLAPSFRFNVVVFDCSVLSWASRTQSATQANKADAIAWLDALFPVGGSTGTGPAVAWALQERENLAVVLLTDGDPNCGANFHDGHRAMIRDANLQGATITVFGIDAWGDYRAFCLNVAADSGGTYVDVTTPAPVDTGGK